MSESNPAGRTICVFFKADGTKYASTVALFEPDMPVVRLIDRSTLGTDAVKSAQYDRIGKLPDGRRVFLETGSTVNPTELLASLVVH